MNNSKPPDLPTSISAAKAAGAKYYFTGKPCLRGHVAKRTTADGVCFACRRDWMRNYYDRVGRARYQRIKRNRQVPNADVKEMFAAAIAAKPDDIA